MKEDMDKRARINFWIDALAFLSFVVCTVSGYAIMDGEHGLHQGNGINSNPIDATDFLGVELRVWSHLHLLTGWILVVLVIVHMVVHRRWISAAASKSIWPGR